MNNQYDFYFVEAVSKTKKPLYQAYKLVYPNSGKPKLREKLSGYQYIGRKRYPIWSYSLLFANFGPTPEESDRAEELKNGLVAMGLQAQVKYHCDN